MSKAAHAVAQMLVHQEHCDWRYDPGNDAYVGYYENALEILAHALPHLPEYLSEVESRESHAA